MNKVEKKNILCRLFLFLFVVITLQAKAQSLQRQTIGSTGSSMVSDNTLLRQTVGQPFSTNTTYSDEIEFRPGFQQPILKVDLIHTTINMDVFPNPTTSWVTMQSTDVLKDVSLKIVDITGRVVIDRRMDEFKTFSFNCEDWNNGVYLISLIDGKKNSYSSKLIVSK